MVRNCVILAREVKRLGGTVSFEWPEGNMGWEQEAIQKMIEELETTAVIIHGCTLGVEDKDGNPILKPWRIESTSTHLVQDLQRYVCTGGHVHGRCEGSETEKTGYYPKAMARAIFKALSREELFVATKEELEAFDLLPAKEKERLVRIARKIHANTGHRNVEALARHLRQRGAPLESRAAMEQVKRDSCQEYSKPESGPPATFVGNSAVAHCWNEHQGLQRRNRETQVSADGRRSNSFCTRGLAV